MNHGVEESLGRKNANLTFCSNCSLAVKNLTLRKHFQTFALMYILYMFGNTDHMVNISFGARYPSFRD